VTLAGTGTAGEPVFVCGLGRSGTTWIARSLAASPDLVYIGEAWLIQRLAELVSWHETLCSEWGDFTTWHRGGIGREDFLRSVSRFYGDLLSAAADGRRFVEKTPEWNLFNLSLLAELFPGACYILIYRDGRNYVASTEAKSRQSGQSFDFEDSCRRWARAMEMLGNAHESGAPRLVRLVRYEDLLDDFRSVFTDLCEFVGIEPIAPRTVLPNSAFPNHYRAQDFKTRWHGWSEERKALFREKAGEQLVRWGYVSPVEDW
jgi:sulfotransferase family protein